jgi:hypothetical protein
MAKDWLELTRLTGGSPIVVERVRLTDKDIAIEGEFDLPSLARLPAEDQIFVMAFIKSDGSIKELERIFGISYPTVKNRLARIASQIEYVEMKTTPSTSREAVMQQLEQGEISAEEAIKRLSQ